MAGRPPKEKSFANMLNIALKQADGKAADGTPNTNFLRDAIEAALALTFIPLSCLWL